MHVYFRGVRPEIAAGALTAGALALALALHALYALYAHWQTTAIRTACQEYYPTEFRRDTSQVIVLDRADSLDTGICEIHQRGFDTVHLRCDNSVIANTRRCSVINTLETEK